VVLTEHRRELVGFACMMLDKDPQWGACLDNLHVMPGWRSRGDGLCILVLRENSYASRVVEVVQGQRVVTTGPCAIVRHPMYLGAHLGGGATAVTEKVIRDIIAGSTKKAFLESNLKAFDLGKETAQKLTEV